MRYLSWCRACRDTRVTYQSASNESAFITFSRLIAILVVNVSTVTNERRGIRWMPRHISLLNSGLAEEEV